MQLFYFWDVMAISFVSDNGSSGHNISMQPAKPIGIKNKNSDNKK